jgi:hypothetical protein
MQKTALLSLLIFLGTASTFTYAIADSISPHVDGNNTQYSGEPVNAAFFGTGPAAYLTEASQLRFQGAEDTRNGKPEQAMRKLAKAVQLDPGDPDGHLLYARALTAKIKASPADASTLPLVYKALDEWKMLWHHDADSFEQTEAKNEAKRMTKIAKAIIKQEHVNHGISQEEALAAATHRSLQ